MPYADQPKRQELPARPADARLARACRCRVAVAAGMAAFVLGGCSSLSSHLPFGKDSGPASAARASRSDTAPRTETAATPVAADAQPAQAVAPGSDAAAAPKPAQDGRVPGAAAVPAAIDPAVLAQFEAALGELGAGHLDSARSSLESLAQSHPDMGGVHANLGIVLRKQEHLADSAAQLQTAVALNPQQPVFWNQLGITYRQMGRFTDARDAYQKAMAADPSYGSALLNLAILTDLYLWDGQSALALYEKYQSLQSEPDPKVAKWIADLKNRLKSESRGSAAPAAEQAK